MAINYEPVGWDTTKYFNPTNMNHMDDGIKAACDKADANEAAIADVNSKLGNTDISAIGDGTVTGGLDALNNNLETYIQVVPKSAEVINDNYLDIDFSNITGYKLIGVVGLEGGSYANITGFTSNPNTNRVRLTFNSIITSSFGVYGLMVKV